MTTMAITGRTLERRSVTPKVSYRSLLGGRCQGTIAGVVLCCWATIAAAGDWRIIPRFSLSESVTDNVTLVDRGESADLITQVTPGVSVRGTSARLESNIDYNLQRIIYADNSDFDQSNHQLQGDTSLEIVKNWLYFDSRSTVSQQLIDNTGIISRDNRSWHSSRGDLRSQNSNRSDVVTYEFAPSIKHRFGSWANAELSYSNLTVDYTSETAGGRGSSKEDEFNIRLASGEKIARFPVTLTFESRTVDFDSGRKDEYDRLNSSVSYVVNRKLRVTGTGGFEDNSSMFSNGRSSGPSWSVGGTWTPSPRTSISGSWGRRAFGDTFDVSADYRRRRWRVNFDYKEDVRTLSQFQRELSLVPLVDQNGDPFFDPVTSSNILIPLDTPSLTEDSFINRRMNAGFFYDARRTSTRLRFFRNDREFGQANQNELQTGLIATVTRRMNTRLDSGFDLSWRTNESGVDGRKDTFMQVGPYIQYAVGPILSARIAYEFASSDGERGDNDYTENVLSARLNFHL